MDSELRAKLRSEIMAARWSDLVYQFACGRLLLVSSARDLLDVATALATDDRPGVELLLAERTLWRASDDDARAHANGAARFQFVIVQPWVLAQELRD